ncbi:stress-induced protein KIN2-like isoform X2 [Pistacia vera]|uniref:stress-induced protein KIN2-like isoform X2 n=1 Tax=Pistacia vera TaxID=55513 RepID=UPI0012635E54|nr:stress-induced protein KIN2-like isoform X2 [Pistacia vera]
MEQSQNTGFQAGQATGQAQEKGSQLMDKANNAAQSAKESCEQAGQQMQDKAQGAAYAAKNAAGINK